MTTRIEEELGLYLVREALETLLDVDQASIVLLEALLNDPHSALPPVHDLSDWVDAPLRGALVKRLGEATAQSLLRDLRRALFAGVAERDRNAAKTLPLPRGGGRVNLLAAAAGEQFARKLAGGMSLQRYSIHSAPDLGMLRLRWQQARPLAVIWHGGDPIDAARACARLVTAAPAPVLQIVWQADAVWGTEFVSALRAEASSASVVALALNQGVDPLFHVLKSFAA